MGPIPLPLFKYYQIVPPPPPPILVSVKYKSVYNNFLNHKMGFENKKQNLCKNYIVLYLYNRIAIFLYC